MTEAFHPLLQLDTHPTVAERTDRGRAERARVPRKTQAQWDPASRKADPIELLIEQEKSRVPGLLSLRHERMGATAFTFYRGTAVIMASDLASQPSTELYVQACGDAHLSNFGLFAAPDRKPVFDLNDFDETNPGPFEWDVKRLATSFVLAAQDNGFTPRVATQAAAAAAAEYRRSMAQYAAKPEIDIWYERVDASSIMEWSKAADRQVNEKMLVKSMSRAQARTVWTAVNKLTEIVDGHRRFINDPPLIIRVPEDTMAWQLMKDALDGYIDTLAPDRRALLRRYEVVDLGHKVVGVGSVGLLAWVALMEGRDSDDVLVLQIKQAQQSVLEPYTRPSDYAHSGERVVEGQRLTQAASDSFLGWVSGALGRQYYVRQLRDMKWSPDPASFRPEGLVNYAELCGHVLARAHARSGDAIAIASYIGNSTRFDDAIASYALEYADQVQRDFAEFQRALEDGRLVSGATSRDLDQYMNALRNPAPVPASS